MGGHHKGRHIHIIRKGETEVLPTYEPVENQRIIPAIKNSSAQRVEGGVAILFLEILHIAAKQIFTEGTLPGGLNHWRQGYFTIEGNLRVEVGGVFHGKPRIGLPETVKRPVDVRRAECCPQQYVFLGQKAPKRTHTNIWV